MSRGWWQGSGLRRAEAGLLSFAGGGGGFYALCQGRVGKVVGEVVVEAVFVALYASNGKRSFGDV